MDDKERKLKNKKDIAYALAFPFTCLITLGISIFIGIVLDDFLNTKPIFLIVFILLGIFTVYYRLIKTFLK